MVSVWSTVTSASSVFNNEPEKALAGSPWEMIMNFSAEASNAVRHWWWVYSLFCIPVSSKPCSSRIVKWQRHLFSKPFHGHTWLGQPFWPSSWRKQNQQNKEIHMFTCKCNQNRSAKSETRDRNTPQPKSRESPGKHWVEVARNFTQAITTKPHPLSDGEALLVSLQNLARYWLVEGRLSLIGCSRMSAHQKSVSSASQNVSP